MLSERCQVVQDEIDAVQGVQIEEDFRGIKVFDLSDLLQEGSCRVQVAERATKFADEVRLQLVPCIERMHVL